MLVADLKGEKVDRFKNTKTNAFFTFQTPCTGEISF